MIVNCPKCQSLNIRSTDNQPLFHPTKEEVKLGEMRFDNEVYMTFECLDCKESFDEVFDLVPRKK